MESLAGGRVGWCVSRFKGYNLSILGMYEKARYGRISLEYWWGGDKEEGRTYSAEDWVCMAFSVARGF